MISTHEFMSLVGTEIYLSRDNHFTDNWDTSLFGERKNNFNVIHFLKVISRKILPSETYNKILIKKYLDPHIPGLTYLYNKLEDAASKDILIKIMAYRIVGHRKIKLPLSNNEYWERQKKIEGLIADKKEVINISFKNIKLRKYDLRPIGYPISLFFVPFGIMADFVVKQYVYEENSINVKAEQNDTVIDAGACWGDTALFFADAVGEKGKVYSFEFVPGNIDVFNKNMLLNPSLKDQVQLVNHPVWKESGMDVYYTNNGPGSIVSMEKFENYYGQTTTLSIDDLVKNENISKVDFIKMDIEGAEPFAMEGARETIIKHKPKLAISIYHSLEHFSSILQYIESLELDYKFYLKHATIHNYETILFAKA